MKQNLEGITKTLLIPLWTRAMETKMENPIIRDEKALEMMDQIDYDFEKFEHGRMPQVSIAIRTELLDKATHDFMDRHPDGTIVNMGCGLDTRYSRLNNQKIYWYAWTCPSPSASENSFLKRQNIIK